MTEAFFAGIFSWSYPRQNEKKLSFKRTLNKRSARSLNFRKMTGKKG